MNSECSKVSAKVCIFVNGYFNVREVGPQMLLHERLHMYHTRRKGHTLWYSFAHNCPNLIG